MDSEKPKRQRAYVTRLTLIVKGALSASRLAEMQIAVQAGEERLEVLSVQADKV